MEMILDAKRSLYNVCDPSTRGRLKKRTGANKRSSNIQDIIVWLRQAEINTLPNFVSQNLDIASVDARHFDFSTCMSEMRGMKNDLCSLTTDIHKDEDELCAVRMEVNPLKKRWKGY